MAEDLKNSSNQEINSTNIFDEFDAGNTTLAEEVEMLKDELNKDIFYYLHLVGKTLAYIFWLLLFLFLLSYIYIYIQKNEDIFNKSYLDPICDYLLGDTPMPDSHLSCSSLSFTKKYYDELFASIKKEQTSKVLPILNLAYEQENFIKSKEITFLLNKSENKLRVLDVLEKFDVLKNDFGGIDKRKIQCNNIVLDSEENTLSMSCDAYSKGFERGIIGFSGLKNSENSVGGTSISIANSFLNFIDKSTSNFSLINKQRVFTSMNISGEQSGYTNKTSFDLLLKINF